MSKGGEAAIYVDNVTTGAVRVGTIERNCRFSDVVIDGWRLHGKTVLSEGRLDVQPWSPARVAQYDQHLADHRRMKNLAFLRPVVEWLAGVDIWPDPYDDEYDTRRALPFVRARRRVQEVAARWSRALAPPSLLRVTISNFYIETSPRP